MKNKLTFAIFIPLLVSGISINAQRFIEQKITNDDGRSIFVTFNKGTDAKNLALSDQGKFFSEILNLPAGSKLVKTESAKLFSDFSDEKYQLYHDGIKVEFANYVLHYIKGNLVSMNGEVYDTNDTNIHPDLSEAAALKIATKYVGAKVLMNTTEHGKELGYQPKGELVLLPVKSSNGKFRLLLSYKFDIFSAEPFLRSHVYVDAKSGAVLLNDLIMKHAGDNAHGITLGKKAFIGAENQAQKSFMPFVSGSAQTLYSGTKTIETTLVNGKYVLKDATRGGGVNTYTNNNGSENNLVKNNITDADNNWSNEIGLDVHWGVEKTYDYFKDTFNRNSYDNQGAVLNSYVHAGNSFENAFWSGSEMVYGDGGSTFKPLGAFDVTAHELGHAVCQSTANLAYQKESGALNEGLSDIWGAVVENAYAPEKQNFLMGEDIVKVSPNYLRSMSNPNSGLSKQPDTYKGTYWKDASSNCSPNDNNDYCGVHTNSGVINYWFYLVVKGGSGTNDIGNSFNVSGIGFEKAAKIVYRLETSYLTSNSTYNNTLTYGIQAAKDLFGADSAEHQAVQNAFYAVGLGQAYSGGGNSTDNQAPTAPQLSASSTTQNATVLSWSGATDNVAVTGYDVYKDNTLLTSTTSTTYSVTGLSPATSYNFTVKAKDAAGNISPASNSVNVTTLSGGGNTSYCTSSSNSASDESISNVKFANINKSSTGTSGYENFTSVIGNVTKGKTYPITVTPYWPTYTYGEAYAVYIDYNGDGDFADSGELAWSQAATIASSVSGNITIPTTSTTGDVRMRVILKYNSLPASSCGTFDYGQVEDYTLRIAPAAAVTSLVDSSLAESSNISVYPNPAKDVISIKSSSRSEFKYQITDALGKVVLSGNTEAKSIKISSLLPGAYIITLDNGEKQSIVKIIKN